MVRDSVFVDLFSKPRNHLELLKSLYPSKNISQEDISSVGFNRMVSIGFDNDITILLKDRFVILVESQAAWSSNILFLLVEHLLREYRLYFEQHDQDLYSAKNVNMPRADFYVIYSGPDNDIANGSVSLTNTFFSGEPCSLEVNAKVICSSAENDILNQYIEFSKRSIMLRDDEDRTLDKLFYFIKSCKDDGILEEYLSGKEEEVVDKMNALFEQEDAIRRSTKAKIGQAKKEGRKEGEDRFAQLMSILFAASRIADAKRAAQDESYRHKLYNEFGLTIH